MVTDSPNPFFMQAPLRRALLSIPAFVLGLSWALTGAALCVASTAMGLNPSSETGTGALQGRIGYLDSVNFSIGHSVAIPLILAAMSACYRAAGASLAQLPYRPGCATREFARLLHTRRWTAIRMVAVTAITIYMFEDHVRESDHDSWSMMFRNSADNYQLLFVGTALSLQYCFLLLSVHAQLDFIAYMWFVGRSYPPSSYRCTLELDCQDPRKLLGVSPIGRTMVAYVAMVIAFLTYFVILRSHDALTETNSSQAGVVTGIVFLCLDSIVLIAIPMTFVCHRSSTVRAKALKDLRSQHKQGTPDSDAIRQSIANAEGQQVWPINWKSTTVILGMMVALLVLAATPPKSISDLLLNLVRVLS